MDMSHLFYPAPLWQWWVEKDAFSVEIWIFHSIPSKIIWGKFAPPSSHPNMGEGLANMPFLCRSGHPIQLLSKYFLGNWSLTTNCNCSQFPTSNSPSNLVHTRAVEVPVIGMKNIYSIDKPLLMQKKDNLNLKSQVHQPLLQGGWEEWVHFQKVFSKNCMACSDLYRSHFCELHLKWSGWGVNFQRRRVFF